jgi:hypothetical protein
MGRHVHNRTDTDRENWKDRSIPGDMWKVRTYMLLIIGVLITLSAAVLIPRVRVPRDVNTAKLGCVSEQWLVEHRASHPS